MTQSSKIQARREREKQEMTEMIVQAAREMFLEEGYEKVSIRKVAERIAYSPGTIYNYFKNKDELFHVVHEIGFQELFRRLEALHTIANPMDRLQQMGQVYWEFALEHPDDYDLMFIIRAPMNAEENEKEWLCGFRTFDVLKKTVMDCQEQGHFQHYDPNALCFTIWSTVHGMVTLFIRDRLKMYDDNVRAQLGQAGLLTLDRMLRSLDS